MRHLLIVLVTITSLLTIGCDENSFQNNSNSSLEKGIVDSQSTILSAMLTRNSWCLDTEKVEEVKIIDEKRTVKYKVTLDFFDNGDLTITSEKNGEFEKIQKLAWSLKSDDLRIYTSKTNFTSKKASIVNNELVINSGVDLEYKYYICEGQEGFFQI